MNLEFIPTKVDLYFQDLFKFITKIRGFRPTHLPE